MLFNAQKLKLQTVSGCYLDFLGAGTSRTLIAPALRHALACKGNSVRALGQTLSDFLGNIKVLDILLSSRGVDGCCHKKDAKTYPYFCSELFFHACRKQAWKESS